MDPKEVLKLIEAGFTAAEVRAMMVPAKEEAEVKPEEPKAKPKPEPEKKPEIIKEPEKKEEPAAPAFDEVIAGINKKVDDLTAAIGKISKINLFPALDNIKPLGIDDIVDKFFKEE